MPRVTVVPVSHCLIPALERTGFGEVAASSVNLFSSLEYPGAGVSGVISSALPNS